MPMILPIFRLLDPADALAEPGELVWEGPHEKVAGAFERQYTIPGGHVVLTIWRDHLHEVIYQTPADDRAAAVKRNEDLFAHYSDGHAFIEILDNGFGKTYRRSDKQRYALWSYSMDFTTIGTMEFHAVEWGN